MELRFVVFLRFLKIQSQLGERLLEVGNRLGVYAGSLGILVVYCFLSLIQNSLNLENFAFVNNSCKPHPPCERAFQNCQCLQIASTPNLNCIRGHKRFALCQTRKQQLKILGTVLHFVCKFGYIKVSRSLSLSSSDIIPTISFLLISLLRFFLQIFQQPDRKSVLTQCLALRFSVMVDIH